MNQATIDISDDWFCIYRPDGHYLSDACVEGPLDELEFLATAIENRGACKFKRCAAMPDPSGGYLFWSPRNSTGGKGWLSMADADGIAAQIRAWQAQGEG